MPLPEKLAERDAFYASCTFDTSEWSIIRSTHKGRTALIRVTSDALKIDGVRCAMSARQAQVIADRFGWTLPTSLISDLAFAQADVKIGALERTWNWKEKDGSTLRRIREQSDAIDALIAGRSGLVADVGKDWILDPKLTATKAVNHGFRELNGHVWQQRGAAHGYDHIDYSQLQRFVARDVWIDEIAYSFDDMLRATELLPFLGLLGTPVRYHVPMPTPAPETSPDPFADVTLPEVLPFTQAKNYYPGRQRPIRMLIVHTAEIAEVLHAAENLAAWAARQAPASWHYAVDADSVTQSVRDTDTAWHAGKGANADSIGVELAARAMQGVAGWSDDYSLRVLELAAQLFARLSVRYGIPPVRLTHEQIRDGSTRGICGHVDITQALKNGTHGDPGPDFPWARFLARVRALSTV